MANNQEQDIELGLNRLEYGDHGRSQRAVMTISTGKGYNGGLRSSVTVSWCGDGFRQHAFGMGGGGGDFSKALKTSERVKATQKALDKQHAEVFTPEVIAQLTEAAKAHYEMKHHPRCASNLDDPCDCENLRLGDAVVRAAQGGDNA